jgi:hypothetical protein
MDNGTHLVLGCNRAVFAYLQRIGAVDRLRCIGSCFPMVDLDSGARFVVGNGWPQWPGVTSGALLRSVLKMLGAREAATVAEACGMNERLLRIFWRPLCVAILNTAPEQAALGLLRRTLWEMLRAGRRGRSSWLPVRSLSDTFIDPAATALRQQGAHLRLGMRLKAVAGNGRLEELVFATETVPLRSGDQVILALPPQALGGITGGPDVPDALKTASAIANLHFHVPQLPETPALCGLVGGLSDWVFRKGDVLAVTISAADGPPLEGLAERVWHEVVTALNLPPLPLPPHRVVIEKRSTPLQTPAFARTRPRPGRTAQAENLWLVGDWTGTGIPCTIESALSSALQLRLPRPDQQV